MAQDTDESKASILPDPELNPLLNPLLAANMGRWAEVYFTSPPEKRAQAIADLLRELEGNSTPQNASTQASIDEGVRQGVEEQAEAFTVPDSIAAAEPLPLTCASCGYKNSSQQRFCGMCGSPLMTAPEDFSSPPAEAEPSAVARWHEPDAPLLNRPIDNELDSVDSAPDNWRHETAENLSWLQPEQSHADLSVLSGYQPAPASRNYKIYAGMVLAILLALLAYMTWRGNAAFWSGGATPSARSQAAPAPPHESEPTAAASAPPSSKDNPAPTATPASSPQQSQSQTGTHTDQTDEGSVKPGPVPRIVPATASSSTPAAARSGSEELATAEKYLNAAPGGARDSRQAAAWLWKAVGKQNLTATLLLSDLYLRGDGVTKSCDQARLLLDAAARKGERTAAERLRNLQAFGCQ